MNFASPKVKRELHPTLWPLFPLLEALFPDLEPPPLPLFLPPPAAADDLEPPDDEVPEPPDFLFPDFLIDGCGLFFLQS